MKIIFFTQGNSLDTFYEVQKRLKKKISLKDTGYYVSNHIHYKSFILKNPDFEKKHKVIKEWEIYDKALQKNVI